jgi:NCS1 family nucleobase:cation symporter-1
MYIYNLNFFMGFLVSSGVYWLCCHYSPIPATSDHWMEVGDEIKNLSVAYDDHDSTNDVEAQAAYIKSVEADEQKGHHRENI